MKILKEKYLFFFMLSAHVNNKSAYVEVTYKKKKKIPTRDEYLFHDGFFLFLRQPVSKLS